MLEDEVADGELCSAQEYIDEQGHYEGQDAGRGAVSLHDVGGVEPNVEDCQLEHYEVQDEGNLYQHY